MNEAINLRNLKMLFQIGCEQAGNILTATSERERESAEDMLLIAFKEITKIITSNVLPLQEKPVSEAVTGKANVQNTSILCES